jgi:nucleotide-binding universal stress UspA family protein
MVKSILVAVHESPVAAPAMGLAARLANHCRASLRAAYVADPDRFVYVPLLTGFTSPLMGEPPLCMPRPPSEILEEEQRLEDEEKRLRESFAAVCQTEGLTGHFQILQGRVEEMILNRSRAVDWLVIGHRPRGRHDGSLVDRLLRRSVRPVLVVGETLRDGPILFCYDGSRAAQRSLAAGAELLGIGAFGPAHVLTVDDDADDAAAIQQEAREYLEAYGSKPTMCVDIGDPGPSILKTAEDCKAGLIVMGAYGDGLMSEAIFGSTTTDVLESATCPILLVS